MEGPVCYWYIIWDVTSRSSHFALSEYATVAYSGGKVTCGCGTSRWANDMLSCFFQGMFRFTAHFEADFRPSLL